MMFFGSKEWFQAARPIASRDSIVALMELGGDQKPLKDTEVEEIACKVLESYTKVTREAKVAYLHRKEQRLKLKDEIKGDIRKKLSALTSGKEGIFKEPSLLARLENEAVKILMDDPEDAEQDDELILGMAELISAYILFKNMDKSIPDNVTLLDLLNPELLLDGRLYQPPYGDHNWLYNLGWMLAHIHNGNKFLICTEVLQEYLYRRTPGYKAHISGFAREVAVLMKLDYSMAVVDGVVVMQPGARHRLTQLALQDIVMQNTEIEQLYLLVAQRILAFSKATVTYLGTLHAGLQYQSVVGAGDCLYRAVSYYLGDVEGVTLLRSVIATNLATYAERYRDFMPFEEGQALQDYIAKLAQTQEEVINILMQLLDRPIVVVGSDGAIINSVIVNRYLGKEPIFVCYNEGHYDALLLHSGYDGRDILQGMLVTAWGARAAKRVHMASKEPSDTESQVTLSYK